MEAVISEVIRFLTELAVTAGVIYGIFRNSNVAMVDKAGEAAVDHANAKATSVKTDAEALDLYNRAFNELFERDQKLLDLSYELGETRKIVDSLQKTVTSLQEELEIERRLRQLLQKELDQERRRNQTHRENDLDKTNPVPYKES